MSVNTSSLRITENKKRRIFFLKVFVYLTLFFSSKSIPAVMEFLERMPGLQSVWSALLFLLGGNILISLGRIITARIYLSKAKEEKIHGNFLLGITWISNILNSVIFGIALLLVFDIRPLELLTSLTIVAAAIALLTKDYVTNIINGLIIMFTDQFALGDTIKVGDQMGEIEDITLLNIVIRKEDGYKTMVPNILLLNTQVTNYSQMEKKKVEFTFELGLNLKTDLDVMETRLGNAFSKEREEGKLFSLDLGIKSIQKEFFTLQVNMEVQPLSSKALEHKLHQELLKLIQENG